MSALKRFRHRYFEWPIRPCGEYDCTMKVCVAASRKAENTLRQQALERARQNPRWSEATNMFTGDRTHRSATFEAWYREAFPSISPDNFTRRT